MLAERSAVLLVALVLEAGLGYPAALYRGIRHPVVWVGELIGLLERRWNAGSPLARRVAGCAVVVVLVTLSGGAGWLLETAVHGLFGGRELAASVHALLAQIGLADGEPAVLAHFADSAHAVRAPTEVSGTSHIAFAQEAFLDTMRGAGLVIALIATSGLAQRSLYDHVRAVLQPLERGELASARQAVAQIVGRDTGSLGGDGVSAAAIESLAESFCDGVVAPAFWFLVAGLPGLFIFKAISTADSLIGHRDERHGAFGWAAARTDDLLNLLPARLSGLILCIAGPGGLATMLRDARKHESPNAGWPEAAMAGVLARELGGPASYAGEWIARPTFGAGARPDAESLREALRIYRRACCLLWLIVGAAACLL